MFEGNFSESEQQTAILEEMEGVVSVRSLEALVQWLYTRTVRFDSKGPSDRISAAIEFVRLADMCNMTGMQVQMAQYIKEVLVANPDPKSDRNWRYPDRNTYCLKSQHIASASFLPSKHPVRRVLATACLAGYIRSKSPKFSQETQDYPSFGADLLQEVSIALQGLRGRFPSSAFVDPLSGRVVDLNETCK